MPQDELEETGREIPKRAKTSLAQRDFIDLELVRRRLNDAMLSPTGQASAYLILDMLGSAFVIATITRILDSSEMIDNGFTWNTAGRPAGRTSP